MGGTIYLALFVPLLFGFVHGLLFAMMLLYRSVQEERIADVFLAALIAAGCLLLLPTILGLLDIHVLWNEWLFLPLDPGLLIGPLLYLFILAQTNRSFRFRRIYVWHFVPFFVYAIYHLVVFTQGSEFVFTWLDNYDLPYIDPVYKVITLITMSAYLGISIQTYAKYRVWLEEEYVSPEKLRYPWISRLLMAVGIAIAVTCLFRLSEVLSMDIDNLQAWWVSAVITICIYYVSIAGLFSKRPPEYSVELNSKQGKVEQQTSQSQYSEKDLQQWLEQLTDLMDRRHLYLNPDLGLGMVAKELGLSRKSVSAAINACHGTNFRRFVNEYRVRAFKNLVSNGRAQELTLYGMALDCGFNSKATFNRVFRQITGMAPNQFAEEARLASSSSNQVAT